MHVLIRRGGALALSAAILMSLGCATAPPRKDYTAFRAADPRSILILPPVNRSTDIRAPELLLSTVPACVAERGYYVFPVNTVKRVLEDDGLADADLVHAADPARLRALFGADAVLYLTIESWTIEMAGLDVGISIEVDYVLRDGKTGDLLWRERGRVTSRGGSSDPIASLFANALLRRLPPSYVFVPHVNKMNAEAIDTPGLGLPAGPYHGEYGGDRPKP